MAEKRNCTDGDSSQIDKIDRQTTQIVQSMKEKGDIAIEECPRNLDLQDKSRFKKVELSPSFGAVLQQLPGIIGTTQMAQLYTVSFPKGLPHTLTMLKQGGYGSPILENGKFVGSASFLVTTPQALMLGAFTAMSIVSGQYFLSQINNKLETLNWKLDKILEFLYGDKKSELLSEISFAKYAYDNFESIMVHEQHRVATITSLQQSKKVAMKDIEFYLNDLNSIVKEIESRNKKGGPQWEKDKEPIQDKAQRALDIGKSIDLSIQLLVMSSILEMYYAENFDLSYVEGLEDSVIAFIEKCNNQMLTSFGGVKTSLNGAKVSRDQQDELKKRVDDISNVITSLQQGGEKSAARMRDTVSSTICRATQFTQYYLCKDGSMYFESSADM